MSRKPKASSNIIPDDPPDPVTPDDPLVGLETSVLQNWLENSPELRRQASRSPAHRLNLENAVRRRVWATMRQTLELRADGLSLEQAEEQTHPAMWTPPTWSLAPTSPSPKPAADEHDE